MYKHPLSQSRTERTEGAIHECVNCHDRARDLLQEKHKDLQKIRKVFVTRDARHSPRLVRLPSVGRTELETMRKEVDFRLLLTPRRKVAKTS